MLDSCHLYCTCIILYSPDGSSDSEGVVILHSHIRELQRQQCIDCDVLAATFLLNWQSRGSVFITAVQ